MKFEKIDGVQYIFLEKYDQICIATPDELETKKIEIKSNDKGLEIYGNSSIVHSINGEGMLEKVNIPPVVSAEEIIEKCDKWLDIFKQVHDTFKKIVLTDQFKRQNVVMELSFPRVFDNNVNRRTINLTITQNGTVFKKGINISTYETNEDVYSYLVANVLDYYISQNLENTEIDLMEFSDILYSDEEYDQRRPEPILARIKPLIESDEDYRIIANIISNHNIGESSEQLIANLRNRISNQQIGNRFESDINYSSNRCERILKKVKI